MDNAQAVGFGQPVTDLLPNAQQHAQAQAPGHMDHALQVFAVDVFHGDEMGPFRFADIEHLADIPVADPAGQTDLVAEPLDRLFIGGDLRLDELQGNFLFDLGIEDLVDPAHPAFAQLLDHLVAAGEGGARGEFADRCLKGFRHDRRMVLGRREPGPAISAELLGLGILD